MFANIFLLAPSSCLRKLLLNSDLWIFPVDHFCLWSGNFFFWYFAINFFPISILKHHFSFLKQLITVPMPVSPGCSKVSILPLYVSWVLLYCILYYYIIYDNFWSWQWFWAALLNKLQANLLFSNYKNLIHKSQWFFLGL